MNSPSAPDSVALNRLGNRLAALRLALNLTQADVAEQAGVSKRTIERLEAGATATQLSTFLRVCRVLGLQDRLEQLLPEPAVSPVSQLRQQRQTRKRASGVADTAAPAARETKSWDWAP